ncbi:hypothetical protein [Acinetobacter sp. HY1485]|uniref:hypothetical protein n=1 Tax=Acinetobacter sp. HY1485 TaxID=2970918 RepID=UPI0022B9CD6B|nr:hypothetical protein [Acinetobacter sp. HY1485]
MGLFNHLITTKLETKKEARYNSPELYLEYLTFLGHTGKVDQIYFSIRLLDKSFIDSQKNFFDKSDVFLRLENLIKRIEDKNQYGIKNFLIKNNEEKVEIYKTVEMYFKGLQPDTASHEQNFILNFMLNMLIEHKLLNTDLAKSLVEYFWKAKNCNNYRKDFSIFSIVNYCFDHNMQDFFALRKQFYNHIQKIYNQIYKSSLLKKDEIALYQKYLNDHIKSINHLKSKSKYKVAICISGLYRNHENALKSIKDNLIDPLDADVFVHTWDQKAVWTGFGGTPHYTRVFGDKAQQFVPKEIYNLKKIKDFLPCTYSKLEAAIYHKWDGEEFLNYFKPKKILIENQDEFVNTLNNKENYTLARGSLNQIKMFYGLQKSLELAFNHDKYDYIIRIRPDILVNSQVSLEKVADLENNIIYTNVGDFGLQDFEFMTSSSVAYNFSNFIKKMFDFEALSPYEKYPLYDAHNLMLSWMIEGNYRFDKDVMKRSLLNMVNRKILIDGLNEALDQDFENLSQDNKAKFIFFVEYLRENYC